MALQSEPVHTVAASSLTGLLAYAHALGVRSAPILEQVGLREQALAGPETRIAETTSNQVWALVATASADPDFGLHFAERMTPDTLDVVGHILTRSRTFGAGLERVVALSRILHDAVRVRVERRGPRVVVFPGCVGRTAEFPRHVAEFSAAAVLVLGRLSTGRALSARVVRFRHPAPARVSEHARIFGVLPTFGAHETEVELDADVLGYEIHDAQPGLVSYLDAYARSVVAKLPAENDLPAQVERVVAVALSRGLPDLEYVANQLGMSGRTLQRRLTGAGTTFQERVDEVRRQYAAYYLADDRLPIAEIAFLLGFSEPSNFHRAFRRWTGMTPAAYREGARSREGARD